MIKFFECMRGGKRICEKVWRAFQARVADDLSPEETYLTGHGLAMYWETLARWSPRRARRDAEVLGVPLVFLQAADECSSLSTELYLRLLNVASLYKTGKIHGVFAVHIGMRVRFTEKFNAAYGLVQGQTARVVDFVWGPADAEAYEAVRTRGGFIFRPQCLPAGLWLEVDDFVAPEAFAEDHGPVVCVCGDA